MILCSIESLVQAALAQLLAFTKKIKFELLRPLGFAGHPAIRRRCSTAVGSFKFEFSKFFLAESICLKLSFRLHVVAWQPDNGKYVRLKSRVRLNIRVQGVDYTHYLIRSGMLLRIYDQEEGFNPHTVCLVLLPAPLLSAWLSWYLCA